jgi:hypothetical protein
MTLLTPQKGNGDRTMINLQDFLHLDDKRCAVELKVMGTNETMHVMQRIRIRFTHNGQQELYIRHAAGGNVWLQVDLWRVYSIEEILEPPVTVDKP